MEKYYMEVEGNGTKEELASALRKAAFAIENATEDEVADANDEDAAIYSDKNISCEITPMA